MSRDHRLLFKLLVTLFVHLVHMSVTVSFLMVHGKLFYFPHFVKVHIFHYFVYI